MEWTKERFSSPSGTIDHGREFEILMSARVGLNLVLGDEVDNFKLSANVEQMGKFDDIVVEINGQQKYGIQLKYNTKPKSLSVEKLQSSLVKHYRSYCTEVHNKTNLKTIIIEKISSKFDSLSLTFDGQSVAVHLTTTPKFISNIKNVKTYCFLAANTGHVNENLQVFLERFIFVTTEASTESVRQSILEDISTEFKTTENNANKFIEFVQNWYYKRKKVVLKKTFLQQIIALQVLEIFVPDSEGEILSEKEELFFKIITEFSITVFTKDRLNELNRFVVNALSLIQLDQYNRLLGCYQLSGFTKFEQKLIVMWLEKKFPLVITSKCDNKIIQMLSSSMTFILISPDNEQILPEHSFRTLNDLKLKSSSYYEIVNLFQCKLQGKVISLKELSELSEKILTLTTANELMLMMYNKCTIGKEEDLPSSHISRNLSRHIFPNEVCNIATPEAKFVIRNLNNCTTLRQHGNLNILFEEKEITKLTKRNCHYFEVVDNETIEWIKSSGNINKMKNSNICQSNFLCEKSVIEYEEKVNVHAVCGMAGMGKTTLMRSIANNSSFKRWNIFIEVRNHSPFFENFNPDLKCWLEYILREEQSKLTNFELEIFKIFLEKLQIRWFWDGLDELLSNHWNFVFWLIRHLSANQSQHWITTRDILRDRLESKLNLLCRNIEVTTIDQQKKYIQQRLDLTGDRIEIIFPLILKNVTLYSNNSILEVPLHLYILTYILLQDEEKYKNLLQGTFTIVDLYEHFVNEKFYFYFKKEDVQMKTILLPRNQKFRNRQISSYKRMALKLYFDSEQLDGFNLKPEEHWDENANDEVGLILKMIKDNKPQFIHNSFGEYFAACFLFENREKIKDFKDFFFNEKFDNIRLFFDLLLARNFKAHTAALYRNWELLEQCTEKELTTLDDHGRSVLHVMCSWGRRFPHLETYDFNKTALSNTAKEDDKYIKALENLVGKCDPNLKEKIFNLDSFALATSSRSMLSSGILIAANKNFSEPSFELNKIPVLFACLLHDYSEIFHEDLVIPNKYQKENFDREVYFEHIAAWFYANNSIKRILNNVNNNFDLNAVDPDQRNLLHVCCVSNNVELGKIVVKEVANMDVSDARGEKPIHCCCRYNHIEMMELLFENGTNINEPDDDGSTPLLTACSYANLEAVQMLLAIGSNVDQADKKGTTPLIRVSINGCKKIAEKLLEKGAKINLCDDCRLTPIHRAIISKQYEIIELLLANNVDVNVIDPFGYTLLDYAHQQSNIELVKALKKRGVMKTFLGRRGRHG